MKLDLLRGWVNSREVIQRVSPPTPSLIACSVFSGENNLRRKEGTTSPASAVQDQAPVRSFGRIKRIGGTCCPECAIRGKEFLPLTSR
jgi:hypothetical protein